MIKEIQGLRCIAILFVVFIHLPVILPTEFFASWKKISSVFSTVTGVELFFVLAGYFLMYSLSKIENLNWNTLLSFLVKKYKRLAPAAYFGITVALLFSFLTHNVSLWLDPNIMLGKFFSTLLWFRNFNEAYSQTHLGYFWAISLEFQFFVIFSVLYFLLGKKNILYLSVLICLVMMFYRLGENNTKWLFRFDPMLYGVLVYCFLEELDKQKLSSLFTSTKFWIFLTSVLLIFILASNESTFRAFSNFKTSVSAITSSIMLVLALSRNNYFYLNIKPVSIIVDWISSRSYSIFCCHIISWCIVKQLTIWFNVQNEKGIFLLGMIFMLLMSEVTYKYIEGSFVKNK